MASDPLLHPVARFARPSTACHDTAGNWKIDCQFNNVPDYQERPIMLHWRYSLRVPRQGCRYSYNSLWVQTENNGHSYCHFNGNMRWDG